MGLLDYVRLGLDSIKLRAMIVLEVAYSVLQGTKMTMKNVNGESIQQSWSQILDSVLSGDEVVVENAEKPDVVVLSREQWQETKEQLERLRGFAEAIAKDARRTREQDPQSVTLFRDIFEPA